MAPKIEIPQGSSPSGWSLWQTYKSVDWWFMIRLRSTIAHSPWDQREPTVQLTSKVLESDELPAREGSMEPWDGKHCNV